MGELLVSLGAGEVERRMKHFMIYFMKNLRFMKNHYVLYDPGCC